MLQPRKNRQPLRQKHTEEDSYPTLMVALEEKSSSDTGFDLSGYQFLYEISVHDINMAGMGIASPVPLNVGQYVFFDDKQLEWDLPKHGIVMWTFQDNEGFFRAGIKFA